MDTRLAPVDLFLDRLEHYKEYSSGFKARCPAHDDTSNDSLSVKEDESGKALLYCFGGCSTEDVVNALGLEMKDLFPEDSNRTNRTTVPVVSKGGGGDLFFEEQRACTLDAYSKAKGLPVEFLKKQGLSDKRYFGKSAVRIPYKREDGTEAAVRFRIALKKTEDGDERFRWSSGSKTTLYGLWKLKEIRTANLVVLCEGESDVQTLMFHGIPALGIPGANTWREAWSEYLEGIEKVYLVVEPDSGGETLLDKLSGSREEVRNRIHLVELDYKDVSEFYLANRAAGDFKERMLATLKSATPLAVREAAEANERASIAWQWCKTLATETRILDVFRGDLKQRAFAGETRLAELGYLAIVSRWLERPISIVVKGTSSSGKSYLIEQVLDFFPESAYYALTAMSEHALAYSEEPLRHRYLVIYEAAGMNSEFGTYLIRSLLSEGRVRYETVESTAEGVKPRLIEREGPTGLLITTTANRLHPENETRMLSLTINDTHDQTAKILAVLAAEDESSDIDLSRWLALQEWLEAAEHRVTIPYAQALANKIPPVAVRLRRDFTAIQNLIRAHAILHQANRDRDQDGRIIADIDDYAVVRELVVDLVSEGVEATVSPTVRETVEVVTKLLKDSDEEFVTYRAIGEELELEKNPVARRARLAIDAGYLKNLEDRKGRPARIVLGEPMPEDQQILPTVEELESTEKRSPSPPRRTTGTLIHPDEDGAPPPQEPLAAFFASPPEWFVKELDMILGGKLTAKVVATHVADQALGDYKRWLEALEGVHGALAEKHSIDSIEEEAD